MKKGKCALIIVLIFFVLSSILPVFAGGQQEPVQQEKEIELLTFFTPDGTGTRQVGFKKIVDKFTEETGIKVRYTVVPWNQVNTQLILSELSGNSPDISFVEGEKFALHMAEDTLRPLTNYINRDMSKSEIEDHLNWNFGVHTDGEKYVFPISYLAMALFIRSDLLEAEGLSVPTTWDELIAVAKAINTPSTPGLMFPASPAQATQLNWFQPIVENFGGKIIGEDGRATFNSPGGVKAFQLLRSAIYDYKITPVDAGSITYDEVTDMFAAGRLGMIFEGSHRYLTIASRLGKDKITLAPIPGKDKTSPSPTTVVGWTLGIPRGSEHPDEAWEFIKFFNRTENALEYAKISGEIPFLKSVSEDTFFEEEASEHIEFFVDYINNHGISIASPATAEELVVTLAEAIQRVVLEPDTEIQVILDAAVNEYNQMVGLD